MTDGISIVIPTLNRETCLLDTVGDILKQTHRNLEVIIVDQSAAPANSVIESVKGLINLPVDFYYFQVSFKGLPLARNFGWQRAKYENIIYVDDDVRFDADFCANHFSSLRDEKVALVAGGIEEPLRGDNPNPTRTGQFNRWTAMPIADFNAKSPAEVDHVRGCNFSVKKSVIVKLGGFDESLNKGAALYEELEFCLRAKKNGYRIFFAPNARLTHLVHPSGGCRVPEIPKYVRGLCRNSAIIIFRYLAWYHQMTAAARLAMLLLSYTKQAFSFSALFSGLSGFFEGVSASSHRPINSSFSDGDIKFAYQRKPN